MLSAGLRARFLPTEDFFQGLARLPIAPGIHTFAGGMHLIDPDGLFTAPDGIFFTPEWSFTAANEIFFAPEQSFTGHDKLFTPPEQSLTAPDKLFTAA